MEAAASKGQINKQIKSIALFDIRIQEYIVGYQALFRHHEKSREARLSTFIIIGSYVDAFATDHNKDRAVDFDELHLL